MPIPCVCQNNACGKTFFKVPAEIARGAGRYCSRACASAAQTHVRICSNPTCGKEFLTLTCRIKKGGGIYCSKTCQISKPLVERFWEKVQVCAHGRDCIFCCFPWLGATDGSGYGVLALNDGQGKRKIKSHRLAYEIWNNRLMNPLMKACHHCDFKLCNNGFHLHQGTQKQNIEDAVSRNRVARGERQAQARLETKDIALIWSMRAQGTTLREIAHILKVCDQTIGDVLRYRTWKHISHAINDRQPLAYD